MLNHQLCKKACAQFSEVGKVACDLFEKEEPTLEEVKAIRSLEKLRNRVCSVLGIGGTLFLLTSSYADIHQSGAAFLLSILVLIATMAIYCHIYMTGRDSYARDWYKYYHRHKTTGPSTYVPWKKYDPDLNPTQQKPPSEE